MKIANAKTLILPLESSGVPVVVGEWSLATDNCAMWLNGLNDNYPGYPKVTCDRVMSPDPYCVGQPGAPPNSSVDTMDPRGSGGDSFVIDGTCPRDKASSSFDLQRLAYAHLSVFDRIAHGQFFWNFRTELEPVWDFQIAVEKGWIPKNWSHASVMGLGISNACGGGIEKRYSSAQSLSSSYTTAHFRVFLFCLSMFILYAIYLVCSRICRRHGQRHKYDEIPSSRTEAKAGAM